MNFWQDIKEQDRYSQIDGTLTSGVQIRLSLRESKSVVRERGAPLPGNDKGKLRKSSH